MVVCSNIASRESKKLPKVIVAPVDAGDLKKLSSSSKSGEISLAVLNAQLQGAIVKAAALEGFKAATKETLTVQTHQSEGVQYIILIGVSEKRDSKFEEFDFYRRLGNSIVSASKRYTTEKVGVLFGSYEPRSKAAVSALAEGVILGGYTFDRYKSKKPEKKPSLKEILVVGKRSLDKSAWSAGLIGAEASNVARDLVNMPPCDCTPAYLVKHAERIAHEHKIKIDVFDKAALKKMGAHSLLSVSLGSDQPPYLIRMTLKPKKKTSKIIALVGKGVTFDSGGLSIKPASGMEDMKCDMSGAAAVLAAMQAIAQFNPKVEVRAYVPTTENMTGGSATRPGDVAKAMNGKTIEILNTDAEGRLILADALCLAEKDGCSTIIDLATLTGACVVALGNDIAGLFTDDEKLAKGLEAAAEVAGDRLWRMPLAKEYRKLIESQVADIKNTGGRWGGAITAALFLKEFVTNPKTSWAHLDIAGPAFTESEQGYTKRGGVGFGVRTLINFVKSL